MSAWKADGLRVDGTMIEVELLSNESWRRCWRQMVTGF